MKAIGYVRVSTARQEIGPEVQVAALQAEALARGWSLEIRREDAASARSMKGRPVLAGALADLRAHRADVLVVAKLDRLSRSVADFARVLDDSDRQGWHLACLDLGVDTTSVTGRAMAHVIAAFAEMERRRISERTREAMATLTPEQRARMRRSPGRPTTLDLAAAARIVELRAAGLSLQAVCDALRVEGVATATGGQWWPATVRQVLQRAA